MIHTRTYLLKWVLFQQSLEMDLTNEQLLTHLRDVEVLAEDVLADKQVPTRNTLTSLCALYSLIIRQAGPPLPFCAFGTKVGMKLTIPSE